MEASAVHPEWNPAAERGYVLLRESCGRLPSGCFTFFGLGGDDRREWLQGQVTQNVRQLGLGSSAGFALCKATGQMVSEGTVWSLEDRLVCSVSTKVAVDTLNRFSSMVILEDVVIQELDDSFTHVSLQGPNTTRSLARLLELPPLDAGFAILAGERVLCLRSDRTGDGGWDLLVPRAAHEAHDMLMEAFEEVDELAYQATRLEAGLPRVGLDYDGTTLPPEMGKAFLNRSVSYQKGCYTGQEVLMRIHSRGHTNKTWMALVSEQPLEVGAQIRHARRAEAGKVTSTSWSPRYGYIAGAMLRTEVAYEGERVTVATSVGDIDAEVYEMPLLRVL